MDTQKVIRKLQMQQNPEILFSDIDGTLFSPNLNLLTAPIYNTQTAAYLKEKSIPFITVTGRSFWRRIDQYHLSLLGMPKADIVITANGTAIYYREKESYTSDFTWQGYMQSTKITDKSGKIFSWNKWDISNAITDYLEENHHPYQIGKGNTYLIRIRLNTYSVLAIEKIRKDILEIFPTGIRVMFTEKLLWKNTENIFSGEMLITPSTAGKDKAVQYVLKNLSTQIGKPIHAFIFGDASIDIPMLTMKQDPRFFILSQYSVNPTPLTRLTLQEKMKTNNHLTIYPGDGPREILWTLRPELRKVQTVIPARPFGEGSPLVGKTGIQSQRHPELGSGSDSWIPDRVLDDKLSPAQNNKARNSIRKFEWILDKAVDKNMSPNEISFLGLEKLSEGLKNLQHKSFIHKAKGMYQYGFGNLTDILDGIRARQRQGVGENVKGKVQELGKLHPSPLTVNGVPGQLVDGFADRAKEFMQLFHRAKKRLVIAVVSLSNQKQSHKNSHSEQSEEYNSLALQTFLAALSCCLPSIARAQVEIGGKTVQERDEKGGSMIDRTRRLFTSLLFDTLCLDDYSFGKDKEIFDTNLATYKNRVMQAKKFDEKMKIENLSDFQKKALERFFLYVDVLQQEDAIITKFLSKHKNVLKGYEKETSKLAKNYLDLQIKKLRKKFGIPDYKLEIKKYINN